MRPLYKIVMLLACVVCCASTSAQIRTVTFTGRDRTNQHHIPLSRVNVFNLDQLWEEILYYPDTVLILGTVGIDDYDSRQNVQLMQNVPNPFDGTTEFALQLPDGGDVFLEIYDITGKLAVTERFTALPVGTHLFQATLSSPQTYLLSAKVDNGKMTIKMVNEGHGAGNTIHHLGMTDKNGDFTLYLKNEKASSSYPFHVGDEMQYEGFALLDGTLWESAVVTQPQMHNDTVPLLFDVTVPTVLTSPVADITASTATCGGVVTSDGNVPVTARGVCWDTLPNPTVDDSFTADSTGVGSFTSHLSGLTDGTTYYVRAYATNSVGTAYGEEREFSTLPMLSPTVTTNTVTDVTVSSATCGGVVTSDGNVPVTARGVCWDTSPNPTVDDNDSLTFNGSGIGSFTSMLSGLAEGTTYYVRAYAINSVDTAYGEQKSFTTQILPSVITDSVSNITTTSAECGGKVVSQGSSAVIYRGVCWSISQNPTVDDSHTTENGGVGSFTSSITGLYAGVRYYVRAYATSSAGTAYGAQVTFVTSFTCGSNTTDHEGNVYHTVQIGQQCWMRSNLRTTHYADGTSIQYGNGNTSSTTAYYYYPDNNSSNVSTYGLLYNWKAVMRNASSSSTNPSGVQGICPNGWHVPSDAEWTQLTNYVSSQSAYWCSNNTENIAKALASTTGWNNSSSTCAIGNNQSSNNATGFAAVPAGNCHDSSFGGAGSDAYFWSSSQYNSNAAYYRYLYYNYAFVDGNIDGKSRGFSVRCLRDGAGNPPDAPTGVTATFSGTQIQVSWNSVSNATSYKVYRSSSANGSYTLIGSPTNTYYYDTNPLTGYNYYKVKAVNSAGESAFSSVASCNYAAVSHTISISLITDRYGSDITWQVKDVSTNTILASGGPYSDLSSNGTTIQDIPTIYVDGTGCYVFIINDSYGDGLCCSSGNGSYSVSYDGVVIGSGGNAFSQETYYLNCPNVDEKSCPAAPTVTDHEGNVYATVQIGSQCWMRDNLRTTTSPSTGTYLIPSASTGSTYTGKQARWYNNDSATYAPMNYGLLYNWNAAVDTFNTAYGETSVNTSSSYAVSVTLTDHRRGICPAGWHLPSDAEWTILTDYVSSQSQYICGNDSSYIAKALASTEGWNTYSGTCAVGYDPPANNASGFGAIPAGMLPLPGYEGYAGETASFWSSTQFSIDFAYSRSLWNSGANVNWNGDSKSFSRSVRCLRDVEATIPTVTTNAVSNIMGSSALCGGNVTDAGGAVVTARGVCWDTLPNPTVDDSFTVDSIGVGSFTSYLSGLADGTTYYVRAYATNGVGTAYGEQRTFTTLSLPLVTTDTVSNITGSTAVCGGNVISEGDAPVTARGVCWSTSINPTVDGQHTTIYGSGTGSFSSNLSGLTGGTTYYVRAYATSSLGTLYGEQRTFTTAFTCGNIIADYDGNSYNTVQIGNQCWMKENLKTAHLNNGVSIPLVQDSTSWGYSSSPAYCYYNQGTYGCLYNYYAVESGQLCPPGWHVPTYNEVHTILSYTLGSSDAGGEMKTTGTTYWLSPNTGATNSSGFSARGSGIRYPGHSISGIKERAVYWTSNTYNDDYAYDFYLCYDQSYLQLYGVSAYDYSIWKRDGLSVRCLRDDEINEVSNPCPGLPTVTDYDGNVYHTVQIGGQCWMKENLRTTRYADGTEIALAASNTDSSSTVAYRYNPGNHSFNVLTYGYLYNWPAVMNGEASSSTLPSNVQGICPMGWHVPSDAEWTQLTNYVSGQSEYVCNNYSGYIAKALASNTGWAYYTDTCAVGFDLSSNNATGFSALPAGRYYGSYSNVNAYFWSSTENNGGYAWSRYLKYGGANMYKNYYYKYNGLSVRCLRNGSGNPPNAPTGVNATLSGSQIQVSWSSVSNATSYKVYRSSSANGSYTLIGSPTNIYYYDTNPLTGYNYYKVKAVNNAGESAFSSVASCNYSGSTDGQPCSGTPTVTDVDNNVYNTVQIGQQCWMAENLRTTKYADGTVIPLGGSTTSTTTAYRYRPNNLSSNVSTYGYLYNWKAVMRNNNSSSANPSGVQGVCPTGWHVPSDAEWTQLTDYVGSQSGYQCSSSSIYIGKALASTTGWETSTLICSVGNNQSTNNVTGFNARPAGQNDGSGYYDFGSMARFWSSTQASGSNAHIRYLYCIYNGVYSYDYNKSYAFSVRCLRN